MKQLRPIIMWMSYKRSYKRFPKIFISWYNNKSSANHCILLKMLFAVQGWFAHSSEWWSQAFSYVRTACTPSKVKVCEGEETKSKRQPILHDGSQHLAVIFMQCLDIMHTECKASFLQCIWVIWYQLLHHCKSKARQVYLCNKFQQQGNFVGFT